ncbi:DNA-binding transcriptional activator TdcA [Leclercia adecarboxylata]|uniref:DNA-binding transcriptional activator TdcA n=1 Tax=Leclercia adecarboxylata TaxID=83655 RepID=A0A4U9IVU3_9ENTR|nr:DNA-binding transcriptional activator TdcA [Leclercia adecarboxylata]
MIKKFKEVFPKARVSMFEAQLSSFLPAIRDGRLDFAIGTLSDEMLLQDLHVEPLFESEFVLVASKTRTCTGPTTLASTHARTVGDAANRHGLLQRTLNDPPEQPHQH